MYKFTHYDVLKNCDLCPHECGADRYSQNYGFCRTGTSLSVASVCRHTGEEPVISGNKGICNVFFSHCNMQCLFCQNYQISNNNSPASTLLDDEQLIEAIQKLLDSGCHALGFVSPSHCVVQMIEIVKMLHQKKYKPIIVYNTNAYDKVSTLKMLNPLIDIYLPDFKYADDEVAFKYSGVKNYTQTALAAIKEMIEQRGDTLKLNKNHEAISGLIIRNLVLPGLIENSIKVLRLIAENFGTNIHISLMSQYYPAVQQCRYNELNRTLTENEYRKVVDYLDFLGFDNGWVQDISSSNNYVPDFSNDKPF